MHGAWVSDRDRRGEGARDKSSGEGRKGVEDQQDWAVVVDARRAIDIKERETGRMMQAK